MKKFILIVVLSILAISFVAFFLKVFLEQKKYFDGNQNNDSSVSVDTPSSQNKPSSYSDYSKTEFDNAISENRVLILYFTANWCNDCQQQDTINTQVFGDLSSSGLVGLRSHILDSETTTETDLLAKKFDVVKENTIVILNKKGAVKFKNEGMLDVETLKVKILEVGDMQ